MARSTARAAAMQMIYEHLAGGEGGDESLRMVYDEMREETAGTETPVGENEPDKGERAYINAAYAGVLEHQEELEALISAASKNWALDRIPWVDRTILLLGAWEILYGKDWKVPGNVAVSEAVELAKRYSDPEQSGRFVNGILGTIRREHGAAQ